MHILQRRGRCDCQRHGWQSALQRSFRSLPADGNRRFHSRDQGLRTGRSYLLGEHNIIVVHAADGRKLGEYQPHYIGSTLATVDWAGDGTALLLLSGDEKLGGMIDGWGRQVVRFTDPGKPVLACDAIDLTGDSRDEVLLWDRDQLWIYTQDNNVPAPEKIVPQYKMPIYSRSNYQMYVSIPE